MGNLFRCGGGKQYSEKEPRISISTSDNCAVAAGDSNTVLGGTLRLYLPILETDKVCVISTNHDSATGTLNGKPVSNGRYNINGAGALSLSLSQERSPNNGGINNTINVTIW